VFEQAANRFAAKLAGGGERVEMSVFPNRQTRFGADPQSPITILRECRDRIRRQPVANGVSREPAGVVTGQAGPNRSNPQRAPAVAKQFAYRPARQAVTHSEWHKPHAIETRQSVVIADPDVAVAGLRQRANGILRQSLLALPDLRREAGSFAGRGVFG